MNDIVGLVIINASNFLGVLALIQHSVILLKLLIIVRLVLQIVWQMYFTPNSQIIFVIVWSVIQLLFTILTLGKKMRDKIQSDIYEQDNYKNDSLNTFSRCIFCIKSKLYVNDNQPTIRNYA